jgi:hypothetical protein
VFDEGNDGYDVWSWVTAPALLQLPAGSHALTLRMREGGYAVDRILLARDTAFVPSGLGPPETAD